MATTPLQLAANRANALLSTGPRTPTGQLKSSTNSTSHGLTTRHALLSYEDPAAYEDHHQSYAARFRPQSPIDVELVTELADLRWRLSRVPGFEVELLNAEFLKLTTEPEFEPVIRNLTSEHQVMAIAFTRLVETKVLQNLFHQEARLARRAEKLETRLENRRMTPHPFPQPVAAEAADAENQPAEIQDEAKTPAPPESQNHKIEPIRVTPQPGRNEPCPCNSGLKFKRCCLNKKPSALTAH